MGELLRDGWMAKSSAGKQGLKVSKLKRDNWQRRYFVLRGGAQPKLVYYKDEEAFRSMGSPSGQLMLRGAEAKMNTVANPAMGDGAEVEFTVQAATRSLPLKCPADEAQDWVSSINGAIAAAAASAGPAPAGAGAGAGQPSGRQRVTFNPLDFSDDGHVFKEGWLSKRSGGAVKGGKSLSMGSVRKNWDKRWFVLKRERLHYFKGPDDLRKGIPERGSCSMAAVKVAEYNDQDADASSAKEKRFKLRATEPDGSERLFTLEAATKDDMQRWVDTIESLYDAVHADSGPQEPAPAPVQRALPPPGPPPAQEAPGFPAQAAPMASPQPPAPAAPLRPPAPARPPPPSPAGSAPAASPALAAQPSPTLVPPPRPSAGPTFNPMDAEDDDDDDDDLELGLDHGADMYGTDDVAASMMMYGADSGAELGEKVRNPLADDSGEEDAGPSGAALASPAIMGQQAAIWKERELALQSEQERREKTVYMEGYLMKKSGGKESSGESGGGKMSVKGVKGMSKGMVAKTGMSTSKLEKWDKRYFVLKFRRLFYYKDQQAYASTLQPRGSLNVKGCEVVTSDKDPLRAKFKLRATEPDRSVRLFTLEATNHQEMHTWLGKLDEVKAEHTAQLQGDAELKSLQAQRAAAAQQAQSAGVSIVALEPEPEPEPEPAQKSAPQIAVKMLPVHLAELVNWDTEPTLQGWLFKQSGGSSTQSKSVGSVRKKEDKRWFVLQHHFVFYFGRPQDFEGHVNPKGALPVAGAQVKDNLGSMDPQERCTFAIEAFYADGTREMLLRAESEQDCAGWVQALRPHVEKVSVQAAEAKEDDGDDGGDENRVFCEGWLAKRSGGKKDDKMSVGELKKKWDTRWFVLHRDRVAYYKSQQAWLHREKAKASIPLQDMVFERGEKKLFKLKAVSLGRVLALEAPSVEDVDMWEAAVNARLESADEKKKADMSAVDDIVRAKDSRFVRKGTAEERLADLQEATSDTTVLAEGWLKKETGGKGGASVGSLKQVGGKMGGNGEDVRYFVLTPLYLRYYELQDDLENDKKPRGNVQMAGCSIQNRNKPGKKFKPKFKLVIPPTEVGGKARMLSLIAGGQEDMDFWVAMLQKAIDRANAKQEQDKTGDFGGNEVARKLSLLTHEGALMKKGKTVVAGKGAMQTRWFRLRDGVLYYFDGQTDSVPINWIPLDAKTEVKVDEDDPLKFRLLLGSGKKFVLTTIIDDNGAPTRNVAHLRTTSIVH